MGKELIPCFCFLPNCQQCGSGTDFCQEGESNAIDKLEACMCFLPSCAACQGNWQGAPSSSAGCQGNLQVAPSSSAGCQVAPSSSRERPDILRASLANTLSATEHAARPPDTLESCACFLPSCRACQGNEHGKARVPAGTRGLEAPVSSAGSSSRQLCRRRKFQGAEGNRAQANKTRRALTMDLAEDSGDEESSFLVELRQAVPRAISMTALQSIGRSAGDKWDFWEWYGGYSGLTEAVMLRGLTVGPAVDFKQFCPRSGAPPQLILDLLQPSHRELLWQLKQEAKPRWLHTGPPCTYWTPQGRWTARRTEQEWSLLHTGARQHLALSVAGLSDQRDLGLYGSLEQPPKCISWKKRRVLHLVESGFEKWCFPSCAWGHCHPLTGRPWKKTQCFAANASLRSLRRPCTCPAGSHQWIQGSMPGLGHCSAMSGQYPQRLCEALATIIAESLGRQA